MRTFLCAAVALGSIAATAQASPGSATSGAVFQGQPTRSYTPVHTVTTTRGGILHSTRHRSHSCTHYAVVTTIFEPSSAVEATCRRLPDWCLVIVADKKGPPAYAIAGPCAPIYLSVDDQEELARSSEFVAALPWNHFGRKNVGYMFAIIHGAAAVWDFDDDNELTVGVTDVTSGGSTAECGRHSPKSSASNPCKGSTLKPHAVAIFNPYPALGSTHFAWPRGFPLESVTNSTTWNASSLLPLADSWWANSSYHHHTIGITQALANFNPDVDAIYRLTRPLPLDFHGGATRPLILPAHTYTPFNGQATLFASSAAWAMYLPVTVHGRVSDIWRSYIAQRLMWDAGLVLAFDGPWVRQVRNEHRIIADLESETFMYLRTDALLQCLREWRSTAPSLAERILQLYVHLYEREYVELDDVTNIKLWVQELVAAGYAFPRVFGGAA